MCWQTCYKDCAIKRIAEKDIEVFKIIRPNNTPYYQGDIVYEVGKVCPIIKLRRNCFNEIEKGYHSYSKEKCYLGIVIENNSFKRQWVKRRFDNDLIAYYTSNEVFNYKVANFIIPKGTKYYENESGEIVSETIKMI